MDNEDRISKLPDGLKESILDYLPIKDAVRTSILCTKWRFTWNFKKRLDFDRDFSSSIRNISGEKYAKIVNKIIIMHCGNIEYVSLEIPQRDTVDLSAWMLNWSRKGIQVLEINYFYGAPYIFSVPPWLMQCQSLRCLNLIFPALTIPDFDGFSNLVTLALHFLAMPLHSFGAIITKCPKLENLFFSVQLSYRDRFLIIDAPNLKNLYFVGCTCRSASACIILKDVPHLSRLFLFFGLEPSPRVHSETFSIDQFHTLHQLVELKFDLLMLKTSNVDCFPHSLPAPLVNLKIVRLIRATTCDRKDITFIFCLLRSTPGLQDLDIELYQESVNSQEAMQVLDAERTKTHNLNQLKMIKIRMFRVDNQQECDYEPMLKLFQILLSSCPNLETSTIMPNWNQESDKLKWVTKLLQFRRLASNVHVVISESGDRS